jgi:hypothetical protein
VVDIFAGSNTTGFVAERECRYWLAFENELQYLAASSFRFISEDSDENELRLAYQKVMLGNSVEMIPDTRQLKLFEKASKYQN